MADRLPQNYHAAAERTKSRLLGFARCTGFFLFNN
jgi:hypothetical protein